MPMIIAILTAAGTLFFALNRLHNSGVNLNAFNPFFWYRRRQWEKRVGVKPMYRLENPMECAALLIVAVASFDGDLTRELKQEIIDLFAKEFGISNVDSQELYAASTFLLKDAGSLVEEVPKVLTLSKSQFLPRHKDSLYAMLDTVAAAEGGRSIEQIAFIAAVKDDFLSGEKKAGNW